MLRFSVFVLLIVGLCSGKTLKEEEIERNKKIHEECTKISGIDADTLYKAVENDSDTEKVKEHLLCLTKKVQLIDDGGEIDIVNLKKHIEEQFPGILANLDEICYEKKADPKDTLYNITKCVNTYLRKINEQ